MMMWQIILLSKCSVKHLLWNTFCPVLDILWNTFCETHSVKNILSSFGKCFLAAPNTSFQQWLSDKFSEKRKGQLEAWNVTKALFELCFLVFLLMIFRIHPCCANQEDWLKEREKQNALRIVFKCIFLFCVKLKVHILLEKDFPNASWFWHLTYFWPSLDV